MEDKDIAAGDVAKEAKTFKDGAADVKVWHVSFCAALQFDSSFMSSNLNLPDQQICLCGDSAVGKSKLIERFLMSAYTPRQVRNATVPIIHSNVSIIIVRLCSYPRMRWLCIDTIPKLTAKQWKLVRFTACKIEWKYEHNTCKTKIVQISGTLLGKNSFLRCTRHTISKPIAAFLCVSIASRVVGWLFSQFMRQVFDVSRKITYSNLNKWFKELRNTCEFCPVICVANKIDLNKKVGILGFS